MFIPRALGLYALMPTTIFLTLSYLVFYLNRKIENGGLKKFGFVVAILLVLCACVIFSTGLYVIITGTHPAIGLVKSILMR